MSRKGDTASRCIFGRFAIIYIPSRGDADIAILKALLLSALSSGGRQGKSPAMVQVRGFVQTNQFHDA